MSYNSNNYSDPLIFSHLKQTPISPFKFNILNERKIKDESMTIP